ncbi:hypothetical protein NW752_009014 [Fusarium irregulare]|uniref:Uncharacterized protein n=1 Tax=Fusarium irregulare TaxID=2494466 RepID=A0A9W8U7W4_9HYPO|nr:hypothetical protein NW766_009249 [Fusarium irregulare]KAJ4010886.1 hypothetical protein NW752_009014 [Fusarium irregulare]
MTDAEKLEPPKGAPVEDPGARELAEESESDDQFTDAASGSGSPKISSPIPKTRVEKVDDQPSHGEVPGTQAYDLRGQDAQPDEIAIAPETATSDDALSTPEVNPPTTVVEEAPGTRSRSYSVQYEEKRKADASPDILVDSDGQVKEIQGESTNVESNSDNSTPSPDPTNTKLQDEPSEEPGALAAPLQNGDSDGDTGNDDMEQDDDDNEANDDDEFGDDFDDFEEGNEDDDFDDFEDGFQEAETPAPVAASQPMPQSTLPFPIPDFDGVDAEGVMNALEPFLATLFPPEELDLPQFPPLSKDSVFFTPRSASLWSQLVAPPPLAPPDWIRSRTRRLFLVSLGVPVDLDEILPASKQKKLVLPSLNVPGLSPRNSSDSRSVSRLRQGEGNNSSTSVDTQGKPSASSRKRRGPPPQPELDLVAARYLCQTTDEALDGMTDNELKAHIAKLEGLEEAAKEALEYWKKRTDEKIGDREAFEGVIENLVKHARKVRK